MKKIFKKIVESRVFKALFLGLNIGVLVIWFSFRNVVGVPNNDINVIIFLVFLQLFIYICLFVNLFIVSALMWLHKTHLKESIFNKLMLLLAIFMIVILIYHGVIENLIDFIYWEW